MLLFLLSLLLHSVGWPLAFCEHGLDVKALLRRGAHGLNRINGFKTNRRVVLHRGAAGGALRGTAGDDQSMCSCDCCDVVERRPDEVSAGVGVKCAPSAAHSQDVCGEQCSPGEDDLVLQVEGEQTTLDYLRFCFFECKPAEGISSPVRTQCIALDSTDVRRVLDPGGNAMDPAFLYSRPTWPDGSPAVVTPLTIPVRLPSQSLLSANARIVGSGAKQLALGVPLSRAGVASSLDAVRPEQVTKKSNGEDKLADKMAGASVQVARSLGSREANASLAEANRLLNPHVVVANLHAAALSATTATGGATFAAEQGAQAYKQTAKTTRMTGLQAVKAEVLRWNATAASKPTSDSLKDENFWQQKAAEAAQEASQPWVSKLLRTQKDISDYLAEGHRVAKEAMKIETRGKQLALQAKHILNTDPVRAAGNIKLAQDTVMEGQRLTSRSQQLFDVAEKLRQNLPQYRYQAQVAANHAVSTLMLSRR